MRRQPLQCNEKPAGGRLSRRALIYLTVLEFKTQIRLEDVVFIERIDSDVAFSTGAELLVDPPGVGVGKLQDHGISQHVSGPYNDALQVQLLVEKV